jgi:predicted aldo/keto reductase-like oxidoreductase
MLNLIQHPEPALAPPVILNLIQDPEFMCLQISYLEALCISDNLVPSAAESAMAELLDMLSKDGRGLDPSLCAACGECESKCPNHLPVSELMSAAKEKWPG